jgi:chromosome segregation ATPase
VELLSSSVEEQVELQRKLQEELFAGKEEYDALKNESDKRKELLAVSEADIQRERQSSADLAEQVRQLNRMLQEAEQKCSDLYGRSSDSEAALRKESDERIQLLEERRALADRCIAFEGQISQFEVSFREGREKESRLLQEIQELKEELRNNMEVSAQVPDVSFSVLTKRIAHVSIV